MHEEPHKGEVKKSPIDPDVLSLIINGASKDIDHGYMVRNLASNVINEWAEILFRAARSAKGSKKIKYASALYELRFYVNFTQYKEALDSLLTNSGVIEELVSQGKKEESAMEKIKRIFKN